MKAYRLVGSAFATGAVFGAGLLLSGMVRPTKVMGFLDVTGAWDPSLAFVMIGAIAVHTIAQVVARRRSRPYFAPSFPTYVSKLDRPLLAGAAIFGIGWGLAGYCPGPALVTGASGGREALLFLPAMFAGMWLIRARATFVRTARTEPSSQ